jgi:hypothetical protein
MAERPEVPERMVERLGRVLWPLPRCREEPAWVGTRWRVGQSTVAHVYGGYDGRLRVTFRAEPDEVIAFENLGDPYFRADWGRNVVGLLLDDDTDWEELEELLTESYCLQAPRRLADAVRRPQSPANGSSPQG